MSALTTQRDFLNRQNAGKEIREHWGTETVPPVMRASGDAPAMGNITTGMLRVPTLTL